MPSRLGFISTSRAMSPMFVTMNSRKCPENVCEVNRGASRHMGDYMGGGGCPYLQFSQDMVVVKESTEVHTG